MTFEEWLDDKIVRKRLSDLYLQERETERRTKEYGDHITDLLIAYQKLVMDAGGRELPSKLQEIPTGFPMIGTISDSWERRINKIIEEKQKEASPSTKDQDS